MTFMLCTSFEECYNVLIAVHANHIYLLYLFFERIASVDNLFGVPLPFWHFAFM